MQQPRFIPDAWDRAILRKQMQVFAHLVARVDYARSLNAARAMLRVLEAAARRLILALALTTPPLAPRTPAAMTLADIKRIEANRAARRPSRRLHLVEPFPMAGALKRFCAPRDKAPKVERIALCGLGLARHYAPPASDAPPPMKITPWDRVMARLDALKDVASRPEHHAARLRRWFARQSGRRLQDKFARATPLRLGAPPGLLRGDHLHPTRAPRDPCQALLFEAHRLASKAREGPPA